LTFVYVTMSTVLLYLSVLSMMLVIRVLYPLFAVEEGAAFSFIYATTEPLIMSVRSVLYKSELFSSMPIDFSNVFAFILLFLIRGLLVLFI